MDTPITIAQFIRAIERLPSDEPQRRPRAWYGTQKEHWLGWLDDYHGPGAYGRMTGKERGARFAYNHIVCAEMLLWLIAAAGVDPDLVEKARNAATAGPTPMQRSAAIRRCVPWSEVYRVLWGNNNRR